MRAFKILFCVGAMAIGVWSLSAQEQQKIDPEIQRAVQALRVQARKTTLQLMVKGKYSCCISPGCTFCTMAMGHCPCVQRLAQGESVCHTCKGGWEAGHGSVPGVKKGAVKAFEGAFLKKVFDERKKSLKRKKRRK